jgi:hypothetical protein
MKEDDAAKPMLPVTLTDREAQAVAGGALALARLGGCPTCTSGGYLDLRAALGQVINPATNVAAVGSRVA